MEDDFGSSTIESFEKLENIGSGTYGDVFRGIFKKTNEQVAIKRIKIELEGEGIPSTALREICILRGLKHPNIVEIKDVVIHENKLYLIFEYLEIDLRKYLSSLSHDEILESDLIKSFLYQLLDGIAYCHSMKILHRDLKPQNVLLDQSGRLKLADFGLSRAFSIPTRPYTKEVCKRYF
jgi:cyclin-dependent kinase 1